MATGRLPDPNTAPVTAKGDLYTYSTVPAKLAVGNNGETLVADSSASTGLRWQGNYAAGKNAIINGDFRIWQRGTSFSNPANGAYTADRWTIGHNGTGATRTVSQQSFTAGTAPVSGYEGSFFYRYAISAVGTGNTYNFFAQPIEDVRTFANQTVTLSFWAKAGSNVTIETDFDQYFGSGGSADVYTSRASHSVTTSWTRFSTTVTLGSMSGKTIGAGSFLSVRFLPAAATTITLDVWGVQVEAGNTATAFQTATGTLAGELAACQRYYWRVSSDATATLADFGGIATASSTTAAECYGYRFPVTMRTVPTVLEYANVGIRNPNGTTTAVTTLTLASYGTNAQFPHYGITVASGLTTGTVYGLVANSSSSAYIGVSAEL